jgi:hypothetical protein
MTELTQLTQNHTEQLNIRLRPDDKRTLEEKARQQNKDLPEWARDTLLASTGFAPDYRELLAELMAVRKALFQILASMAEGKKLTFDSITAIVAEADERKYVMADKRIAAYVFEN